MPRRPDCRAQPEDGNRNPLGIPVLKGLLLSACCLGSAAGAAAQPPAGPDAGGWKTLRVPGGAAALLKTAGLDDALPRTRALREVIRVLYETPEGVNEKSDERRRNVIAYLESISAFERVAVTPGQSAPGIRQADDKNTRRRLEAIAEAIGCKLERESKVYRMTLESGSRQDRRREHLRLAGFDVDAALKTLNAGQPVALSLRGEAAPLPLAAETWTSIVRVPEELAGSLLSAILGDRRAALLYVGLLGTDASTRTFLEQHPALLQEIVGSDRAAIFANFGQNIRVAGGRFDPPGGASALPLWEWLADEPVSRPDRFILNLLGKDGGRPASLYDAVTRLDPARQALVLGSSSGDAAARLDRFRRLYDGYRQLLGPWEHAVRPFVNTLYDATHILALTTIHPTGQIAGPASLRLWRKAFEGTALPADPAKELGDTDRDGKIDVPWMLESMVEAGNSVALRRSRIDAWLFSQRVFGDAPPSSLPDQFVTLRAFQRFSLFMATLERLGVRDPGLYASAVRHADRLSKIEDADRGATATALFQGSVVLVERARLARTVSLSSAERLLRSLFAVPLSEKGEYAGGIGEWMSASLLPTMAMHLPAGREPDPVAAEQTILAAMAGRALSMADSPDLGLWLEGLPYSVDLAAAELARLQAVRAKQHGVPLEAALDFGHAATALAVPGVTIEQLPRLAARMEQVSQAVFTTTEAGVSWLDQNEFRNLISSAVNDIRKIKRPKDLGKLGRIASPFLGMADGLLAQATVSLVYAADLRNPEGPELLDGDPAPRHDWGLKAPPTSPLQPNAWRMPEEDRTGGGWHLQGALLGADLVLAMRALRRVSIDRVPLPPTLSENDQQALAESVVLTVPFDQSDADREALTSALWRGRRRLDAVLQSPSSWPSAAEAMQLRDFRRELLAWTIAHEPATVESLLSLGELILLGQLPGVPDVRPDVWGTSGRSFDGRWTLRYPAPLMFDLLAGRKGSALTVALVPDVVLAVAEAMHDRRVPAVLTRAVLECAMRDIIDEVQIQYPDDWLTLIGQARRVSGRLDEYLASLTAGGPMMPMVR